MSKYGDEDQMKIIRSRSISRGKAEGETLVSNEPISFFGGVDPRTGIIIERNHPLKGKSIVDKILVFSGGKGSTVGSYVIYQLAKNQKGPIGMICREAEPIIAVGAIMAGIPMVDKPESFDFITGQKVLVDSYSGAIVIKE
jgi:predicted aconitase with swiveling domain